MRFPYSVKEYQKALDTGVKAVALLELDNEDFTLPLKIEHEVHCAMGGSAKNLKKYTDTVLPLIIPAL